MPISRETIPGPVVSSGPQPLIANPSVSEGQVSEASVQTAIPQIVQDSRAFQQVQYQTTQANLREAGRIMDENNAFISNLPAGQVIQDVRAGMGPAGSVGGTFGNQGEEMVQMEQFVNANMFNFNFGGY